PRMVDKDDEVDGAKMQRRRHRDLDLGPIARGCKSRRSREIGSRRSVHIRALRPTKQEKETAPTDSLGKASRRTAGDSGVQQALRRREVRRLKQVANGPLGSYQLRAWGFCFSPCSGLIAPTALFAPFFSVSRTAMTRFIRTFITYIRVARKTSPSTRT